MFKVFYFLLRLILYPLLNFALPLFSKKAKERIAFEAEFPLPDELTSFDSIFEVSSEGELEQVRVLLDWVLKEKKKALLIFCSESVKQQVVKIQSENIDTLSICALPVLKFNPLFNNFMYKVKTNSFYMCRYDFFPELIWLGQKNSKRFNLISGSLKNFDAKNFLVKSYLSWCYQSFDKIVASSGGEKAKFQKLLEGKSESRLQAYDFRVSRIMQRQERALENIFVKKKELEGFLNLINSFNNNKKIIFGSFWSHEASIVESIASDQLLVILPHQLDDKEIEQKINKMNINTYIIEECSTAEEIELLVKEFSMNSGVWIIKIKGILCELYTFFKKSYVGGGFGESVHSLLEPFCADNLVVCGPRTLRSTEFDYIKSKASSRVFSVSSFDQVLPCLTNHIYATGALNEKMDSDFYINWLEDV